MAEQEPQPSSRFRRRSGALLKAGGVLATASVLMPQCTTIPPNPTTDTSRWVSIASGGDSERQLLENYKAAYLAFEQATDAALAEARVEKDRLFGSVLGGKVNISKGLDFVIRPAAPGVRRGDCYLGKQNSNIRLAEFPKVLAMFDAYRELCRVQNKIPAKLAEQAKLTGAPTDENVMEFLTARINQMHPDETLSQSNLDFIRSWVAEPLLNVMRFTDTVPVFDTQGRNDMSLLKRLMETKRAWYFSNKTYKLTIPGDDGQLHYFNLPGPEQLMELKRHFAEGSHGRELVDQLETVEPLSKTVSETHKHNVTLLKLIDMPVHITVENPYFGKDAPEHMAPVSMNR